MLVLLSNKLIIIINGLCAQRININNKLETIVLFENNDFIGEMTFINKGIKHKKDLEVKKDAKKLFNLLNNKTFKVKKLVTENNELYGSVKPTEISKIISEKDARSLNPKYFFVMPYAFIREFIVREKKWLKKGGKFILPYPNFKIINKQT